MGIFLASTSPRHATIRDGAPASRRPAVPMDRRKGNAPWMRGNGSSVGDFRGSRGGMRNAAPNNRWARGGGGLNEDEADRPIHLPSRSLRSGHPPPSAWRARCQATGSSVKGGRPRRPGIASPSGRRGRSSCGATTMTASTSCGPSALGTSPWRRPQSPSRVVRVKVFMGVVRSPWDAPRA